MKTYVILLSVIASLFFSSCSNGVFDPSVVTNTVVLPTVTITNDHYTVTTQTNTVTNYYPWVILRTNNITNEVTNYVTNVVTNTRTYILTNWVTTTYETTMWQVGADYFYNGTLFTVIDTQIGMSNTVAIVYRGKNANCASMVPVTINPTDYTYYNGRLTVNDATMGIANNAYGYKYKLTYSNYTVLVTNF